MARSGSTWHPRLLVALTVAMLIVSVLGYLRRSDASETGRVYLRNGAGPVVFEHAMHAERGDACVVCHHPLAVDLVAECSDCHDDIDSPDLFEHDELLEIEAHSCDMCHEIAGDDEAQNCRECHDGAEIQSLYHQQCNGCHLTFDRARFASDDGQTTRCSACHLQ
jgi:hypothetical protein